jgi:GT2 family glycosyltransferase
MSVALAAELRPLQRGQFLGQLEGLNARFGLHGWACLLEEAGPVPLQGPLWVSIEDLLDPSSRKSILQLRTELGRTDTAGRGLPDAVGFAFLGDPQLALPSLSPALVLRVFFDQDGGLELPGSPLRLSETSYELLLRDHRTAEVLQNQKPGELLPLQGVFLEGWLVDPEPLELVIDGGQPIAILPPDSAPSGRWNFGTRLPLSCCDGRVHHLLLRDAKGTTIDESLELVPFQLTPWAALQQFTSPPFPEPLGPLAAERYRSLITWLQLADAHGVEPPPDMPLLQRLLAAPSTPALRLEDHQEEGPLGQAMERQPLALTNSPDPQVSVVVPVHGKYRFTRRCLAALAFAPNRLRFEVIVVDDGSPDHTAESLAREVPGIKVVRHDYPRGFNQACHSGVNASRAPLVVLLNNDTEPCARWLDELQAVFDLWPDTGIAGSQLIYPDGSLQEAGGIVWGNGEPWNYGKGCNPREPRFSYTRLADYVSGASLAITRQVWDRVGGFSPEFSPAYYEDTDLCFKVRAAGYGVRYAPLSRVVHYEGISNGTDVAIATGMKRYQELHKPLFENKWKASFEGTRQPDLALADRVKDRGNVGRALFIDHETPRPDRDAGSHAALVEMELVQSLGYQITFYPANLAWLAGYSEDLQRRGIEVIHAPFVLSLEELLEQRGREFDLVYITRYTTAHESLELVRTRAPQARVAFCNADLHYLRQLRAAWSEGLEGDAAEQALAAVAVVKQQEMEIISQVDLTLSYSDVEEAVIHSESFGRALTARCPWVVEGPQAPEPLAGRQGLAFLGSFNHPPNREAVDHLLKVLWPPLLERLPELHLHLYGSGLSDELAERWGGQPGVVLEGWVADTATVYGRHRLFVAPLRSGAGLKGKVVAAAAHGIPQLLSPLAAEATGLRHGQEVWIARDPDSWQEAALLLCGDDERWQQMSKAAFAYAREQYGHANAIELMADVLGRLDLPIQRRRSVLA